MGNPPGGAIANRSVAFPLEPEEWLGRLDSNQRMAVPKTAALPLGYAPASAQHALPNVYLFGNPRS